MAHINQAARRKRFAVKESVRNVHNQQDAGPQGGQMQTCISPRTFSRSLPPVGHFPSPTTPALRPAHSPVAPPPPPPHLFRQQAFERGLFTDSHSTELGPETPLLLPPPLLSPHLFSPRPLFG